MAQEWEGDIEGRIAAHRTDNFTVRLHDAAGMPVAGARLTARLLRHDFRLGANGFLIRGGGVQRPRLAAAAEPLLWSYEQAFAKLLNYATLPFYWNGYEPTAGEERVEALRTMAVWCREHGIRAKGHPLAWHESLPAWAGELADEEMLARLRARIGRIAGEFRGLVDVWDVCNETTVSDCFDNAFGRWVKKRGAVDCVAEALNLARAANPEAELLYNDYNVSPAFEKLLAGLVEHGASFDAIGIQSHMHRGAWSPEKTWQTCTSYARFGLPLHFTELTILSGRLKSADDHEWHRRHTDWLSTPEGEQRQLAEGSMFYTLLFSHPAVEAITWWDFSDHRSWQGAPAGLLRNDMSLKPLAKWLSEAFGERWTTCAETTTDDAGVARFRGFFGTYTLRTVTATGGTLAGACRFPRRGTRSVDVQVD